jgi:hypothetical protein
MARSYATIDCGLAEDEDFAALSVGAKAIYHHLIEQRTILACGLLDLTLRRWANKLNATDRPHLAEWLNELQAADYILIDKDTEELLIRTFVKWDGGHKHKLRRMAVIESARMILSKRLLDALMIEFDKLGISMDEESDPDGRGIGRPRKTQPPATHDRPKSNESATSEPLKSNESQPGYGLRNVSTDPQPQPETLEREPAPPKRPTLQRPDPNCPNHPGGTLDPCGACGTAKRIRAEWDATELRQRKAEDVERRRAENAARLQAIDNCQLCDPQGYRLLKGGDGTGGVCDHIHRPPGALQRALAEIGDRT